jgi:LDH2 family malate/lactate/ureidoglycolate dehydrogenase
VSGPDVQLIESERLYRYVAEIFVGLGLPSADAEVVSRSLIEADLRGVRSHGVMRVPTYQKGIANGTINPRPSLKVLSDSGSTLVVDGDGAMGQVGADFAMRLTIERTLEHGIAAVGLRNSRHCGAMAHWALMALLSDCIGFAATNAGMNMAPTGGIDKLIGNNPFAVAVPTNLDWPMVMDMATSVAAGGKLDIAAVRGEKIPLGWAIDEAGESTDDPIVARRGTLLPVGGPKGYAMAVMLDVVCGVLTGGRYAAMLGPSGSGQYFQAIAVDRFEPIAEFKSRMDDLINQIHASRLAPGATRIYVPGEIEHNLASERRAKGMPLEVKLVEALAAIAREVGVEPLTA